MMLVCTPSRGGSPSGIAIDGGTSWAAISRGLACWQSRIPGGCLARGAVAVAEFASDWLTLLQPGGMQRLPRNTPRTFRQGRIEHESFALSVREPPADRDFRLPRVPAGWGGSNHDGGPRRPRATKHAIERARVLVSSWCEAWREYHLLLAQLAPLADRVLDRAGVYRHPPPSNDAKGPMCRGFPVCPWCRLYMYRRQLGLSFWWSGKRDERRA